MLSKLRFILNTVLFHIYAFLFRKNLVLDKTVRINLWPILNIHPKAKVIIGKNVMLNSSNRTYHVNMFSKVKISCDKPNSSILIGSNSRIHGSCIHAFEKIEIGNNCLIAANCQIIDANGHDSHVLKRFSSQGKSAPIHISDNVWIGTGCIILPGTNIGANSIISAGSVVHGTVPPNVIYGGNPAKLIKNL